MKKLSFRLWFVVGVMLALSVTYWAGCGKSPSEPTAQETILSPTSPQAQAVMVVQDRYTATLMTHSEVVGTATGLTEDGKPAILVFTKSEVRAKADFKIESLAKGAAINAIPAAIEEVPVMVEVTGEFFAFGGPPGGGGGVDRTARFPRPVPIGVSTGHPAITAGTIGCRVTDGTNVFALSNNHVYAATNFLDCEPMPGYNCETGDPVIQPGSFDGGTTPDDDIGNVFDFEPINFSGGDNTIDAAIASTTTSLVGNSTPSDGYGTPKSSSIDPAVRMRVKKYGRTTGLTSSRISAINATVNVNYGDPGVATFVGQIVISGGNFSAGGDSGSLIVVDGGSNDRVPVGLLFAGSSSSTIANPITLVLERFNVTVDGE
jgi:hypothetical protein